MQPNSRRPHFGTLCALALTFAAASFHASAAPTSITASGAFDSVTGTYVTDGLYVGVGYSATFVFDTDTAAASYAQLTPSTDPNDWYTRAYRFSGAPYGNYATANGFTGGFNSDSTGVRMIDNRYITSAETGGLIADGTYDLVEFSGSRTTQSVCLLPGGCQYDFEYTPTAGEEVSLYVLADSSWISGGVVQQLPNSPLRIWLDVTTYENGAAIGTMSGLAQTTTMSAVPVPAAAWLLGSGLLGLVGVARKRKAA